MIRQTLAFIGKKIRRFTTRIKSYLQIFVFIGTTNLKSYPLKNLLAISLLIMGGALQVVALLGISLLLNSDHAETLPLNINLFATATLPLPSFTIGAIIITGIFILAALFTFLGERLVLVLTTYLEENLAIKFFNYIGSPASFGIIANKESFPQLLKILLGSTRAAGRILRLEFSLIQPFFKAILLLYILLSLKAGVTLTVLLILLISGIAQYIINLRASLYSRQFDESVLLSKTFLKSLLQTSIFSISAKNNAASDIKNNPHFQKNKNDYRLRLQVTEESKFASSIVKASIILYILLSLTDYGNISEQSIAEVLSFSLLLIFFLTSVQTILACLTGISRFYPKTQNYIRLVLDKTHQNNLVSRDKLSLPYKKKCGSIELLALNSPKKLYIVLNEAKPSTAFSTHFSILHLLKATDSYLPSQQPESTAEPLLPYTLLSTAEAESLKSIAGLEIVYISRALVANDHEKDFFQLSSDSSEIISYQKNNQINHQYLEAFNSNDDLDDDLDDD